MVVCVCFRLVRCNVRISWILVAVAAPIGNLSVHCSVLDLLLFDGIKMIVLIVQA